MSNEVSRTTSTQPSAAHIEPMAASHANRQPGTPVLPTDAQMATLARHLQGLIEAQIHGRSPGGLLVPALASQRVMGMRVKLGRDDDLRSQAVRYLLPWRAPATPSDYSIGYLVNYLAGRVVSGDGEHLPVSPAELPYLQLHVTIMHAPAAVTAEAEERLACFTPGKQGLILHHPAGTAIHWPEEALDNALDAARLLSHLAVTASLGPDAWRRDPAVRLTTFEVIEHQLDASLEELSLMSLHGNRLGRLVDRLNPDASPQADEVLDRLLTMPAAVEVTTRQGLSFHTGGHGRTLTAMARQLGLMLRQQAVAGRAQVVTRLTVYAQPRLLDPRKSQALGKLPPDTMLLRWGQGQAMLVAVVGLTQADVDAWRTGQSRLYAMKARSLDLRIAPGRPSH